MLKGVDMAILKLFRRDSGEVFLAMLILFIGLAVYVFKLAFKLILMGVKGEFQILAKFSGITLYVTSIFPGLAFIIAIGVIMCVSLPRVIKNYLPQNDDQTK